ncbi:unnamed protein product [Arctogadus glacialis]
MLKLKLDRLSSLDSDFRLNDAMKTQLKLNLGIQPPAELSWGQTWNQEGPGLMVCGPRWSWGAAVVLGGSSGPGKERRWR